MDQKKIDPTTTKLPWPQPKMPPFKVENKIEYVIYLLGPQTKETPLVIDREIVDLQYQLEGLGQA